MTIRDMEERTRQLLGRMEGDFDALDAERYLPALEDGEGWQEDAPPRPNLPWRRYWARGLDFSLYNTLVSLLMRDFQRSALYIPIFTLIAMLLIEPALLRLFGTTLGKAIFGIRITDKDGGRLSYAPRWIRTVSSGTQRITRSTGPRCWSRTGIPTQAG